ncbi:MAG: VWA domain-containing protein [bacterium]|nr:VWA domain-containing protein [bacterium]
MKNRKALIFTTLLTLMISFSFSVKAEAKELIQMAILLDTSSSMNGLINQAKSELWKIVNEMALAKKNGESPTLEVALYEYGKSRLPAGEGYMRMIAPLTTDLDKISEELFQLTTHGGSEYCGMVIDSASKELKWSKSNNDLKVIFIAGNEPFTQGTVDYKKSCKKAISMGIVVNTIFCGDYNKGIQTQWKDGADRADGKYMNINQNQRIVHVTAPQDKEILRLGKELNKTYIGYGRSGRKRKMLQAKQDANASSMGSGSAVQRSLSKASVLYDNSGWDLLDAVKNEKVNVEEMGEDDVPEEMKKMSKKERKTYVAKQLKKRGELQKKINKLNTNRRKYVAKERKRKSGEKTLDSVMIKTIRGQAVKKNFNFK